MKLFTVTEQKQRIGESYICYVVAENAKSAEKKARMVYWHKEKIPLIVEETDLATPRILACEKYWGKK